MCEPSLMDRMHVINSFTSTFFFSIFLLGPALPAWIWRTFVHHSWSSWYAGVGNYVHICSSLASLIHFSILQLFLTCHIAERYLPLYEPHTHTRLITPEPHGIQVCCFAPHLCSRPIQITVLSFIFFIAFSFIGSALPACFWHPPFINSEPRLMLRV